MIARAAALAFVSAALASAAHADDSAYRACVDRAGASETALMRCGDDLLKRASAAQEAVLTAALADMPGAAAKAALAEEQAAWLAFRDKACLAYLSSDFPRNVGAVSFAVCRADVIAARTKYLKGLSDN
ncbi:MAG TPA: lysozyme inhibitor LprI family protein [Rhodoblastus sp.]|nr:lysozyme inhibitor LprI family protein [Rhodoblastus sp.]